jgi:glucokinase
MDGATIITSREAVILAGDIGGTNTRLAIFTAAAGFAAPLAEATFPSRDYPGLEPILREFLSGVDRPVDYAGFGVAGPVTAGRAAVTNLPWVVDEATLPGAFGFKQVLVMNDLEATAAAAPSLGASDLHVLNRGHGVKEGVMAVVAPGTGLGEAYMTWDGSRYAVHPSEGGHADFAPVDALQAGLLTHLRKRFDHVSYERVCSGMGIANLYAYFRDSGVAAEAGWLSPRLEAAADPAPLIVAAALDAERPCALCRAVLDAFVSILGAAAGNTALKFLATGGVFLGGGIPPRILPALDGRRFMQAFTRKGRLSGLLEKIPVHVILNPKAALVGAARQVMTRSGVLKRL